MKGKNGRISTSDFYFISVFRNPFDVIDDSDEGGDVVIEKQLPQEIEQALKKIAKRDVKTRTKGFNELLEQLKVLTDDEIQEIFGQMRAPFVKIFSKFLLCGEKNCRVAVAEVAGILICKTDPKTFLQPILKEILTVWLLSLFDPVGEVSFMQRKTLESVFPAASKLKVLLEKYEATVLKEIKEYAVGKEKFELLKSVTMNELEGSAEEAEEVIELVKTEIIGIVSLFGKMDEELLFLKDKAFSSSRRCALYRLANSKIIVPDPVDKMISECLKKESTPTGLAVALDLLEKTEKEVFLKVLKSELFTISVLSNAPVSEFKKYSHVLCNKLNEAEIYSKAQEFVKICGANNLMNKERFLSFWKEIAVEVFSKLSGDERVSVLNSLIFPVNSKRGSSSLTAFLPLTAEETLNCLLEAFSKEELSASCKGTFNVQTAFILSSISTGDECELETILAGISLSELQNKELMKVLPESVLTKRLLTKKENETLNAAEMVRLLQSLPEVKAVKVLEARGFSDWEKMLKCSLLTRNTIKRVLFKIASFREFAAEQFDNVLIVSCAFESEIEIFKQFKRDCAIINDALNLVTELEVKSPLLRLVIETAWQHPKLRGLSRIQLKELYGNLHMDAKLFVELECADEDFFPISAFESILDGVTFSGDNAVDVIIFDGANDFKCDHYVEELFHCPLEKFENQGIVAKCAALLNLQVNFKVKKSDFDAFTGDFFELFALSKCLESFTLDRGSVRIECFKDALLVHRFFTEDPTCMNEVFDRLIFDDENKRFLSHIAECLCLEQVLPVRSDILGGLIARLQEKGEEELLLLLLASKHLEREKLSKEFWQVQFREVYKAITNAQNVNESTFSELQFRCAGNFWDKLENPEIELSDDCGFRGPLEGAFSHNGTSSCSFGLARLILFAAPFMRESFDMDRLIEYCKGVRNIGPSMLLALRNVYLQLHLDEHLVKAAVKYDEEATIDEIGHLIFPFYDVMMIEASVESSKFVVLLEMFVSAAEGSREDLKLLSGFAEVFKQRILGKLPSELISVDYCETFDFLPRNFDGLMLFKHVLYRFCMLFPLLLRGRIALTEEAQGALQKREIDRIRRQPRISVESIEIVLKPLISATTNMINLKVKFADEIELAIDLQLPRDFPLSPVEVRGLDKSGLSESKWRSALLSLQTLVRSPIFSGNLLEVVKRWQANALKLFQGLEECAVCYSVLHASDKSLPGPACKQCKHKFHAACLYKWFKSSGNATCPLCRALF